MANYNPHAPVPIQCILSCRGYWQLPHGNHVYLREGENDLGTHQYWKCRCKQSKGCKGRATSSIPDHNGIVSNAVLTGDHTCPVDHCEVNVRKRMAQMRYDAVHTTAPINQVYRTHSQNIDEETRTRFPTFRSVSSSLYRLRHEKYPPIPASCLDLQLPVPGIQNLSTQFDFIYDNNKRIIGFGSDEMFAKFVTARHIQCDGKFDALPAIFKQLYTFHAKLGEEWFPCLFVVMPEKTTHAYSLVFQTIKLIAQGRHLVLHWEKIQTDYERAVMEASRQELPQVVHKGCMFHFSQCLIRWIRHNGLQQQYNQDQGFRKAARKFMTLAFLPPGTVDAEFTILSRLVLRDYPDLLEYIRYIEVSWIEGRVAPIVMWNMHDEPTDRTTNVSEAFHSKLAKFVGQQIVNIYFFLERLVFIQDSVRTDLTQYETGQRRRKKSKKYGELNRRIQELITRHVNGAINAQEFVNAMAHQMVEFEC